MNSFIKTLLRNTRREGWNGKGRSRFPNSEADAFESSETNQALCAMLGVSTCLIGLRHHKAIWKAHALADRCFKYSDKYFGHPTGRSYFNPKFRKVHRAKVHLFYERIMIRVLDQELNKAESKGA